jgi:DNA-binding MurR/RpiR family transcriptional regulator
LGIQSTIEASTSKFTPATQRVASAVLANPTLVMENTISELASFCQTSVASVVRFCRILGLSGYSQLRMTLATELGREAAQFGSSQTLGAEIAKSDTLQEIAAKIASLEMLAIDETLNGLDYTVLERVVALIDQAPRILLFGIGASQFVARDLHHKLFRIGRSAFLLTDTHEAWSSVLLAPEGTVAIGFSHSGETADTVRFVELARDAGIHTLAITGSPDSSIAQAARDCLTTSARESHLRAGAMVSRIAQLLIVDCLFMGVARQRYDETIDALRRTRDVTHPR